MTDEFTDADHERAVRAGQQAMAKQTTGPARRAARQRGKGFIASAILISVVVTILLIVTGRSPGDASLPIVVAGICFVRGLVLLAQSRK